MEFVHIALLTPHLTSHVGLQITSQCNRKSGSTEDMEAPDCPAEALVSMQQRESHYLNATNKILLEKISAKGHYVRDPNKYFPNDIMENTVHHLFYFS